ncbi:Melanoma-associated antigen G1 [Ceratobasidium sp. AG-Ba]|nr:Melanoma-associated antigen G1 [Ceratobasidium sp. AG-Ba]
MAPPVKRYSARRSAAGPSQSQATARGTQGRTQASQATQRGRRAPVEEEEEEEEPEQAEDEEDEEGGAAEENDRRVSLLVRLALSVEHSRGSLRREQINKVVFPNGNTRGFATILNDANIQLRKVFGLELVELMTRAERDQVGGAEDGADEDAPARRKKGAASSKTYIVRSALDPSLIAFANKPDPDITAAGQADLDRLATRNNLVNADDDEIIAAFSRAGTSILGWDLGGEGESDWYNIMCVILGLILVNGRSIADHTLKRLLKPLGLTATTEMLLPITTPKRKMKFPDFLGHLMKLGYIERQRAAAAAVAAGATQQPRKRGRQSQATQDDDEDGAAVEWRWGSRAHAEIGEKAVAEFMVDFMVERAIRDAAKQLRRQAQTQEEEEEEGDETAERAKDRAALDERGQKMREVMMRDVERSAGGHLSEVGKGMR